jgi:signal transduction histidine kinase
VPRKPAAVRRTLDELWLASLQALSSHVAHDLKGALNGASVNLEVVRGRAERAELPIGDVHRFSVSAIEQLSAVIRMTGALLSLARASRGPAEVSTVARQIVALLQDTLRSDGGTVDIEIEGGMPAPTSASVNAVRLALAEALYGVATAKQDVFVRIRSLPVPTAEIRSAPPATLSDEITGALGAAGIAVTTDGHGISIVFPAPAENPD